MDLKLFLGVIKRYKRIVIGGAVLAIVLSVLSYGMPGLKGGKPTIIPRGSETWQGQAELLLSQQGFPYGRAANQVIPGKGTSIPSEPVGDETYMANLSQIYAAVANGTDLQAKVAAQAHVTLCPSPVNAAAAPASSSTACPTVVAAEVFDPNTGQPLPLITLTASAPTAAEAAKLATASVSVFQTEITRQEVTAGTPVAQRVELQTLKGGAPATLTKGYSKSIPMLVLFAVLSAAIALAFILNNHSDDPIRSTRRRLDEGFVPDGGRVFNGMANGHVAEADYGLLHAGNRRSQPAGHRRGEMAGRLVKDENGAAPQWAAADDLSATNARRVWSDRNPPHFVGGPGFEPESRD
jgi:hypothetical protein